MKKVVFAMLVCSLMLLVSQASYSMEDIWKLPVDTAFKDVPLADALNSLFKDTRIKCVVDPRVSQLKVTAILKNVSLETAAEELMTAAGAVVRGLNTWIVVLPANYEVGATGALEHQLAELVAKLGIEKKSKAESHPDMIALKGAIEEVERRLKIERARIESGLIPGPEGGLVPGVNIPLSEAVITKVIPLRYLNPADIAPVLMGVPGIRMATATAGKLVLSGTEEGFKQASIIIKGLDDESAIPKRVAVEATFSVRVTEGKNKPNLTMLITKGMGLSGQPIPLGLSPLNRPAMGVDLLSLDVTPTVRPDGRIALSGKGTFNCPAPFSSVREFVIAATVPGGTEKMVAAGGVSDGSVEVEFRLEIMATTVEE